MHSRDRLGLIIHLTSPDLKLIPSAFPCPRFLPRQQSLMGLVDLAISGRVQSAISARPGRSNTSGAHILINAQNTAVNFANRNRVWWPVLHEKQRGTESVCMRDRSLSVGAQKPATDGRVKTSHLRQRVNCRAPMRRPLDKGSNTWQTYSKWLQLLTSLH